SIGIGKTDIDDMRAAFNLGAADFGCLVELPLADQLLEFFAADDVRTFADDHRTQLVGHLEVIDSGNKRPRRGCRDVRFAFGRELHKCRYMPGMCAATAADDV